MDTCNTHMQMHGTTNSIASHLPHNMGIHVPVLTFISRMFHLRILLWIEQIIPCDEFKHETCTCPHIDRCGVRTSDDHLGRTILPCRHIVGEVCVDPTCVTQVGDLACQRGGGGGQTRGGGGERGGGSSGIGGRDRAGSGCRCGFRCRCGCGCKC